MKRVGNFPAGYPIIRIRKVERGSKERRAREGERKGIKLTSSGQDESSSAREPKDGRKDGVDLEREEKEGEKCEAPIFEIECQCLVSINRIQGLGSKTSREPLIACTIHVPET